MKTLSLVIPPQGISIRQGWLESTPYNVLLSCPYTDNLSPTPPSLGRRWGGLSVPDSVLPLPMGRK